MASINLQGDTSGAITISAPSVAGSNTLTLPATTQTLATQNALGVRNLIINGDMRIAQRGTSSTGMTTGGYYTVDRFQTSISSAGTWTMTQDTSVPTGQGFANSLKMACTTADASLAASDYARIEHKIEGQNLQHLKYGTSSAEKITLSFWVKSNKTGTYATMMYQPDDTRLQNKTYTIDAADTWEKKTITVDGDTTGVIDNDNGSGIIVYWFLGAGSNRTDGTANTDWQAYDDGNEAAGMTVNLADSTSNYINITGVQLEVGDTATPFEHRPYDMELARCMRYYYTTKIGGQTNLYVYGFFGGYNTTGNLVGATVPHPVPMRASPTGTVGGTFTVVNGNTPAVHGVNYYGFLAGSNVTSTGQCSFYSNGNGYFILSAEL